MELLGTRLGGLRGSWGPPAGVLGAPWGILEASWRVLGGWRQNWSRTSSWTVSVFRHVRLGGVLGSFFYFWEAILKLILRLFRRPSAQQTEHAKSMFYLLSEHFGPNFSGFSDAQKQYFTILLGLECHFVSIFTVKSKNLRKKMSSETMLRYKAAPESKKEPQDARK